MNLEKRNIKKIKNLILFAGAVVLVLIKFDVLWGVLGFVWEIIQPFLVGGMIAIVINLPMAFIENKLFLKRKRKKAGRDDVTIGTAGRACSILLSFLIVLLLITLVSVAVIPQLAATVSIIAEKTPVFFNNVVAELQKLFQDNPRLLEYLNEFNLDNLDWHSMFNSIGNFLKNGMGSMLSSTFMVASGIISGTIDGLISIVFSIYILAQKEGQWCALDGDPRFLCVL